MHHGTLLAAAASVPVLVVLIYVVCIVPEMKSSPLAIKDGLQHDCVTKGDLLRAPIADAHPRPTSMKTSRGHSGIGALLAWLRLFLSTK
jgi:hypothetical protein